MTQDNQGDPASPSGSQGFAPEPQEASPPSVSIPIAEDIATALRRYAGEIVSRRNSLLVDAGASEIERLRSELGLAAGRMEGVAMAIELSEFVKLSLIAKNLVHYARLAKAAQGIEAPRAETPSGSVHESPVGNADAPKSKVEG